MNNNNFTNNLSLLLQLLSLEILFQDYNNSDLMNELQHQNSDYLDKIIKQNEKIIKQNEKIIELLERRENS